MHTYTIRSRVARIDGALVSLKRARRLLKAAEAPYARLAVARALASVEGARRHAERGLGRHVRRVRRARRPATEGYLIAQIRALLWDDTIGDWKADVNGGDFVEAMSLLMAPYFERKRKGA